MADWPQGKRWPTSVATAYGATGGPARTHGYLSGVGAGGRGSARARQLQLAEQQRRLRQLQQLQRRQRLVASQKRELGQLKRGLAEAQVATIAGRKPVIAQITPDRVRRTPAFEIEQKKKTVIEALKEWKEGEKPFVSDKGRTADRDWYISTQIDGEDWFATKGFKGIYEFSPKWDKVKITDSETGQRKTYKISDLRDTFTPAGAQIRGTLGWLESQGFEPASRESRKRGTAGWPRPETATKTRAKEIESFAQAELEHFGREKSRIGKLGVTQTGLIIGAKRKRKPKQEPKPTGFEQAELEMPVYPISKLTTKPTAKKITWPWKPGVVEAAPPESKWRIEKGADGLDYLVWDGWGGTYELKPDLKRVWITESDTGVRTIHNVLPWGFLAKTRVFVLNFFFENEKTCFLRC